MDVLNLNRSALFWCLLLSFCPNLCDNAWEQRGEWPDLGDKGLGGAGTGDRCRWNPKQLLGNMWLRPNKGHIQAFVLVESVSAVCGYSLPLHPPRQKNLFQPCRVTVLKFNLQRSCFLYRNTREFNLRSENWFLFHVGYIFGFIIVNGRQTTIKRHSWLSNAYRGRKEVNMKTDPWSKQRQGIRGAPLKQWGQSLSLVN